MTSIPITNARSKLYQLVDDISFWHEPIKITGKRNKAVLISEEDWRGIPRDSVFGFYPGYGGPN